MAALQFWIRGDLRAEQCERLTEIGARAVPMARRANRNGGEPRPAAWTMIEARAGDAEAERAKLAKLLGAEPGEITGPYAFH
ncbi:MAG TPA: hypothetical protein VHZ54_10220 [Solirubrobacterales bacterium]|jgi:hypothetical protein|nr:hypothetical protein [Solirubrobacterales bacterium]